MAEPWRNYNKHESVLFSLEHETLHLTVCCVPILRKSFLEFVPPQGSRDGSTQWLGIRQRSENSRE